MGKNLEKQPAWLIKNWLKIVLEWLSVLSVEPQNELSKIFFRKVNGCKVWSGNQFIHVETPSLTCLVVVLPENKILYF